MADPLSLAAFGVGAAMNIASAIQAAKLQKQNEAALLAQRSEIDRELYQGALENTGARAYLKRLDEQRADALKGVDNATVATGATAENVLAKKDSLNRAEGDAIGNLLIQEEARKRGYIQDKAALTTAQMQMRNQQAQNWMTTSSNVSESFGNLAEAYLDNGKNFIEPEIAVEPLKPIRVKADIPEPEIKIPEPEIKLDQSDEIKARLNRMDDWTRGINR